MIFRDTLDSLDLPDHWIKYMFVAHAYVELHLNQQALEIYFGLQSGGLSESTYLLAQVQLNQAFFVTLKKNLKGSKNQENGNSIKNSYSRKNIHFPAFFRAKRKKNLHELPQMY